MAQTWTSLSLLRGNDHPPLDLFALCVTSPSTEPSATFILRETIEDDVNMLTRAAPKPDTGFQPLTHGRSPGVVLAARAS